MDSRDGTESVGTGTEAGVTVRCLDKVAAAGMLATQRLASLSSCRLVMVMQPAEGGLFDSQAVGVALGKAACFSAGWFKTWPKVKPRELVQFLRVAIHSDAVIVLPGGEETPLYDLFMPAVRGCGAPVYLYPDMVSYDRGDTLPERIVLKGQMGAGKDFIGQVLVSHAGYTRFALADAVKEEVATRHGISLAELNLRKGEFRAELQGVGGGRRGEDPNYWINQLQEKLRAHPGRAVITDVRYINEAETFAEADGLVVHVAVPESVRLRRLTRLYGEVPPERFNHSSETEVLKAPHHVVLSGDLPPKHIISELSRLVLNWQRCGRPLQKFA